MERFVAYNIEKGDVKKIKDQMKNETIQLFAAYLLDAILELPEDKVRLTEANQRRGASTRFYLLSLKEKHYSFKKQELWDLTKIRYGWHPRQDYHPRVAGVQNTTFSVILKWLCDNKPYKSSHHSKPFTKSCIESCEHFKR